ncbi:MAG: hypothetical protein KAH17_06530, partial [Bacteroidales bacterium]|nr:hypothetical protein [Bacteroidales bacterium]
MKRLLPVLFLCFIASSLSLGQNTNTEEKQNWYDMMLDPNTNFFETQKAFYDFWEGKTPEKGQGYSVFKRWEYYWSNRVDVNGNFPESGHVRTEYSRFVRENPVNPGLKSSQAIWQELG